MSWDAIEAAGLAVNRDESVEMQYLHESLERAAAAAERIRPASGDGKRYGRFVGLKVAEYQQALYAKNVEWRFTDRTLCVLWRAEFTDRKNYFENCRKYIRGTRNDVNNGTHSGGNDRPSPKYLEYDINGNEVNSASRPERPIVAENVANSSSERRRWDEFVSWATRFYAIDGFDDHERDYKLKIAARIQTAHDEAIAGDSDWLRTFRRAFGSPNNLTAFFAHARLLDWCAENPTDASQLLIRLFQSSASPAERVRDLLAVVPTDRVSGSGTRQNLASFLLAGTNPLQYPVCRATSFKKGYALTGFSEAADEADEGESYEHALQFLDRVIGECARRDLKLRDRLDAQSILWCVTKWPPPAQWPEPVQQALLRYRGESVSPSVLPRAETPMETLASELLLDLQFLQETAKLLEDRRQLIFFGPPGTGKTYVALKLAELLTADKGGKVDIVQFHPAYAYEDFLEGFRPAETASGQPGFALKDGPFKRIAEAAAANSDAPHVLVIDEINRGNIAKVFGELFFLLEYRDRQINLQYSAKPFVLPSNLWIIATMNTSDRSIALVDAALRRRFYFVPFFPDQPPIEGLLRRWLAREHPDLSWVADVVDEANRRLADRNASIGPSYFMRPNLSDVWVDRIWKHAVRPYVEEHFFGEDQRWAEFDINTLRQATAQSRLDEAGDDEEEP